MAESTPTITFAPANLGKIEEFDEGTENFTMYIERLEEYFTANDILEDRKKRAVLNTVIGKTTYALLCNLISPKRTSEFQYTELKQILHDHFTPKVIIIAERFTFYNRNQQENESITQYQAELRRLSSKCDFKTFLFEALRDRFVCGLRDSAK